MSDITLSKAVRSNLLNLQSTANLLGKAQERLSSGLRVNSALDNPTNFFTAQGLNSRANDLSQLSDAVSNAVQTVAAADKGITAITKLVESAQATARQALQTSATVTTTTEAAAGTITASQASVATASGTLTINGQDYTITSGDDATDIKALIDADSSADFTATIGTGADAGKLIITGNTATTDVNITATVAGLGLATGNNAATAASSSSSPNPKRAELVETYNDLLGQIDALAKDSGFNGVNLLNGDNLSVLFNEDGSSKLDIEGVTNTASSLGLTSLTSTAFDTNSSINATLDKLGSAIDTLRSQSSKFGANLSVVETRQDLTKQMISVLQTGASNLTLADTNEEAANVLALQTRQQLSSTALSLASQADQNVLRLF
jgi:flagellin-like hook-associated protein FlgL